jgi:DNA-binding HxlR family transcriptional regulator
MPQDCKTCFRQITLAARLLQGKWKLQTLCSMRSGPVRLSQLTRLFPSASKKALRAALRDLEQAGIVTRQDLSNKVLHVEYDIAVDMKETMHALLNCLTDWAEVYETKSIANC